MNETDRMTWLKYALMVFGAFLVVGIYPLMNWWWPSGWAWEPRQPEYEQMIAGVYATLGVFLLLAARKPAEHLSLIRFTIWSSLVHAGIMLVQGVHDHTERANLLGDVPALIVMACVLGFLLPRDRVANPA